MFNRIIIQAIHEKRKLQFTYKNCLRVAEPHVFGQSTKENDVILCWQTGGSSSKPRDLPNWRMFEIKEIHNLQLTNENFIPQTQRHNPLESDIRIVYAKV